VGDRMTVAEAASSDDDRVKATRSLTTKVVALFLHVFGERQEASEIG
jgi:hypothetical protein